MSPKVPRPRGPGSRLHRGGFRQRLPHPGNSGPSPHCPGSSPSGIILDDVTSPKLCVVTVTCNDPAGLRLTLESLRPLFAVWPAPEWEHIVVDGAPTLSRPVLDGLPAGWPLVHLERPPHGVPDAFNQALAVATSRYIWFLNGGDTLRDPAALSRMLTLLDEDRSADLVGGGAYLHRDGRGLYPMLPRRTLLGNILGRSWICHQAVIYRRSSMTRVGLFWTAPRVAGDYDYHVRCYLAGLRGRFTTDVLVNYDMAGGSNDIVTVFTEFRQIQRLHADALPAAVNWVNEIVRTAEYARIRSLRRLAATPIGASLRPSWATLNRWFRTGKTCRL
jgi:glycosyltransferase involved in cell wall biosynthesis